MYVEGKNYCIDGCTSIGEKSSAVKSLLERLDQNFFRDRFQVRVRAVLIESPKKKYRISGFLNFFLLRGTLGQLKQYLVTPLDACLNRSKCQEEIAAPLTLSHGTQVENRCRC